MSYDLYLMPKDTLSLETFRYHFEGRAHFELLGKSGEQAYYANEDTGVEFYFEHALKNESADADEEKVDHVFFNVNYYRPHIFGMEAARELENFAQTFPCDVHDPQVSGMGNAFSIEGFLRGWNSGNRLAYRTIRSQPNFKPRDEVLAPTRVIEDIWTWNFNRKKIQQTIGPDTAFVSRMLTGMPIGGGALMACATWSDQIPVVLPKVATHVFIVRTIPEPGLLKRLLGMGKTRGDQPDFMFALVDLPETAALPHAKSIETEGGTALLIDEKFGPSVAEIAKLFAKAQTRDSKTLMKGVSMDSVLNQELAEL